jgi:hypothetical protein
MEYLRRDWPEVPAGTTRAEGAVAASHEGPGGHARQRRIARRREGSADESDEHASQARPADVEAD